MHVARLGWRAAVVFVGLGLVMLPGCRKQDPSRLDQEKWVARSHVCARETLENLKTRVEEKVQEAQKLLEELQKHLLAQKCPNGKHPDCIPMAGIQAITTLISSAAVPVVEEDDAGNADMKTGEGEAASEEPADSAESLDRVVVETAKRLKAKGKLDVPADSGAAPAPAAETPAADSEPGPLEIARKADCGMDVPPECTLLAQDTVVSKLALFVEQAAQLEVEVQRFLEAAGARFDEKPVAELFESIKTLESQIHELVSREELATRRRGRDLEFFEAMKPQVIKGIISDLSLSVPKKVIADLNDLVPRIQKAVRFYDEHASEWTQKLHSTTRNLHKSQRVHANFCLTRPNCWQFRQCVKRYELPGILMLE